MLQINEHNKVKPSPTTATSTTNVFTSKNASLESLPLKQDKIVRRKFKVAHDIKPKLRKNKELHDPIIDTPEYKLLCKLFVPSKYFIQNDNLTIRQLSNHLPSLISNSTDSMNTHSSLNFELHLFLCSVTTKYITSWYLNKLNTENLDFIRYVYTMLCDFTKDFTRRLTQVFLTSLIELIDELCEILDHHIQDTTTRNNSEYKIQFIDDYFKSRMNTNSIKNIGKSEARVVEEYLSKSHVIFDQENVETSIDENQRLLYFRILTKKIIQITFDSKEIGNGIPTSDPTSSLITMNLLTTLVADLLLDKLFNEVSCPRFFIILVIDNIADMVSNFCKEKTVDESQYNVSRTFIGIATTKLIGGYRKISCIISKIYTFSNIPETPYRGGIINMSLFLLIDTLIDFSNRKPLIAGFISFLKKVTMKNELISSKIDKMAKWYIYNNIMASDIVSDEFCCKLINNLRENIFSTKDDDEKIRNSQNQHSSRLHSLDYISNKVYELIFQILPNSLPLGSTVINSFGYHNEAEEDLRKSINNILMTFNYNVYSHDNNSVNDVSHLNQLLVIRWIDCVLAKLYPELLSK